jgi:hypothetical protein
MKVEPNFSRDCGLSLMEYPVVGHLRQLIPRLRQWYNEMDPTYGTRMGDYFAKYLAEEAKALGMSVDQVMVWTPPEKPKKAGRKKKA